MWLMLQQPEPDDYVLATGESHSVREFIEFAFAGVGRRIDWRGTGEEEVGVDAATGQDLVRVDRRYFRPTEVDDLLGDASKAERKLGWRPETSFAELVAEMVKSDLKSVAAEAGRKDRGSY
jgi:GDPmannose 4,6-dehydratase